MVCYILSPRHDSQKNHTDNLKIIPGHKRIPSASISFLAISRVAVTLELVASIRPGDVSVIFGASEVVNLFTLKKKNASSPYKVAWWVPCSAGLVYGNVPFQFRIPSSSQTYFVFVKLVLLNELQVVFNL